MFKGSEWELKKICHIKQVRERIAESVEDAFTAKK